MTDVVVTGQLICANEDEAAQVRRHLPLHTRNSLSEAGCLSFVVRQTADPLVWQVDERFVNAAAFKAHYELAVSSEWGRVVQGIKRRFTTS
ncbi:antibiotic biosynthesis monooxygenase [Aeromicrobium sp. SMF47]|uniref:Antibiotic biosynthesis monooxygenase n=1 Tax=Aeromicrobium yanjiei TaxID=2662028 RepID=A0A5Q2MNY6_9ACTN|nr:MULTISPECIES: antibiotic biosynthesis monooxygenase [Aeromicrobium]MRJ76610.1 antibiotic biosynthesis monooxygenase [Aeromicrobium yanjiei]MRK00956.1 antibiotic biosynthesis monooxygenase [Aeromicrobium sp. S22]QGG42235.1 antibiotic biosynthesis monooxygenase [Aeromicrobium yanjiei]